MEESKEQASFAESKGQGILGRQSHTLGHLMGDVFREQREAWWLKCTNGRAEDGHTMGETGSETPLMRSSWRV